MRSTELLITGMTCDHCVKAVTRALMGVDGVINADVSLSGRRAIVKDDGTSSVDSLIAAVVEEGYDANFTGVESKSY